VKLIQVTESVTRYKLLESIWKYLVKKGCKVYFTYRSARYSLWREVDVDKDVIQKNYCIGNPDDLAKQSIPTNAYALGIVQDVPDEWLFEGYYRESATDNSKKIFALRKYVQN